jgi:hypothetical protein
MLSRRDIYIGLRGSLFPRTIAVGGRKGWVGDDRPICNRPDESDFMRYQPIIQCEDLCVFASGDPRSRGSALTGITL